MLSVDLPYARLIYKNPIVRIKDRVDTGVYVTPPGIKSVADIRMAPLHRGTGVLVESYFLEKAANLFDKIAHSPYPYKMFTEHTEPVFRKHERTQLST